MARTFRNRTLNRIMIDSGTMSHITPFEDKVSNHEVCDVSTALGDNSTVRSTVKGERRVNWQGRNGPVFVTLSHTLMAPEVSFSLLSVPALAEMRLGVLFVPERAFIFNQNDGNSVIGCTEQGLNRLLFILEYQGATAADCNSVQETVRAMMAISDTSKYSLSSGYSTSGSSESSAPTQYETGISRKEVNASERPKATARGPCRLRFPSSLAIKHHFSPIQQRVSTNLLVAHGSPIFHRFGSDA